MKKFSLLLSVVIMSSTAAPGFCNFMNSSNNTHDMQMIKQQQFRIQEFDDYKDYKEQKEARQKKEEQELKKINARTNNSENTPPHEGMQFKADPETQTIRIERY